MKDIQFDAKDYDEWSGIYTVRCLTANDMIDASRKFEQNPDVPPSELVLESLALSISKEGKNLTVEEIRKMPAKLYQVLVQIHTKLNLITKDEATFLSHL